MLELKIVWAEFCGACEMTKPMAKAAAEKTNIKYEELNIEEYQDLVIELKIMGTPTLLLYKDGEVVWRNTGFLPEEVITKEINKWKQ